MVQALGSNIQGNSRVYLNREQLAQLAERKFHSSSHGFDSRPGLAQSSRHCFLDSGHPGEQGVMGLSPKGISTDSVQMGHWVDTAEDHGAVRLRSRV